MFWRQIGTGTYLYRKRGSSSRSLGVRSPGTEDSFSAFLAGRETARNRASHLSARLNEMAPVNRALQLGRLPLTSARILRHLSKAGLIGKAIMVVGTTALYAYERMAAVQVESRLLATGDIDLLLDARRTLKLAAEGSAIGMLAHLQKADRSFHAPRGSSRATNDQGFMVDLIQPASKDRMAPSMRCGIGNADDMQAAEIEGLGWLVNSPKSVVTVIDERGFPVEMAVPDPRSFALHKAWLSAREDREPIKRKRDMAQARLVARMVMEHLPLGFGSDDLSALPAALRRAAGDLLPAPQAAATSNLQPDW